MLDRWSLSALAVAFLMGSTGDYLTKVWTGGGLTRHLVGAWACYLLMPGLWFFIMSRSDHLGRVGVVWTTLGMLCAVIIGAVFFGEGMSLTNKVGVLLCITGVVLTSL